MSTKVKYLVEHYLWSHGILDARQYVENIKFLDYKHLITYQEMEEDGELIGDGEIESPDFINWLFIED